MKNKINIYDVILYKGDFNLLKYRLEVLSKFIKKFIIVEFVDNKDDISEIEKKIIFLTQWNPIIELIVVREDSDSDKSTKELFYEYSLNKIMSISPNFQDVVCFSEQDEFPLYENFNTFYDNLNFEPLVLRQHEFIFNLKYESLEKHMGSVCSTYSQIIQSQSSLTFLESLKKDIISPFFYVIDNGYKLTLFKDKMEILSELMIDEEKFDYNTSKQIHPESINLENKKYFGDSKNIFDYPTENLNDNFIKLSSLSEILIIVNHKHSFIPETLCNSYDGIININVTDDYSHTKITNSGCLETINIFKPTKMFYEVENFETHFISGQIIKLLRNKMFLKSQKLKFVSYFDELSFQNILEVNWESFIQDPENIISTLIKNPSN